MGTKRRTGSPPLHTTPTQARPGSFPLLGAQGSPMWNRRRFVLTLAIGLVSITCLVVGFAQHLSHEDDSRSAGITILLPEATNVHVNMHLQKFSDLAKRLAKSFSGAANRISSKLDPDAPD